MSFPPALDSGGGGVSGGVVDAGSAVVTPLLVMGTVSAISETVTGIAKVETQTGMVNVAMAPEKKEREDGLGQNVQNAIKDGLGIRGDDISTLTQTPGDRVEEPQADGPDAAYGVSSVHVGAQRFGVATAQKDDAIDDVEEGGTTKGKKAPLVPG